MARRELIYDILKGRNTLDPELKKSAKSSAGLSSSLVNIGKGFGTIALKAASLAGAIGGAVAGFVTVKAVRESQNLENALIGLSTVAAGTGQDVGKVTQAAKELSEDGLIPLADASASLKNLLASGLDADQAIKTFNVLKDSAAFGRQGSLDLGEAIRGATEGIKNGNSILVDNAGITKNLSVLQKEYAAELGTTIGALTEAQKLQAIYVGLQREGALFQGDYNKLLQTFSGAVSGVSGNFRFLLAEIGDFITQSPVIITLVDQIGRAFSSFRDFLKDNQGPIQEFVNSLVTGFVNALPVAVNFFQSAANGASYLTGVMLKLNIAGLAVLELFTAFDFVQDIFRVISQAVALATSTIVDLLNVLASTSVGSGFVEKILGLNPDKIKSDLENIKTGLFEFADSVTGAELNDFILEKGNAVDQLIGANEAGIAKLNEGFEVIKENLKANADEINKITAQRVEKQTATSKKGLDKNNKDTKEAYDFQKALFGDLKSFEESTNKERGQNFKSTLGTISTLSQENNSTLFNIGKAAAISTATIDGIAAVQKALASAPPPFNFALASLVGVATAANIARIASAKPPQKKQDGGFVEGSTSSGDRTQVLANDRELFLNRAQQAELFNVARARDTARESNSPKMVDIRLEIGGREIARVIRDLQTDGFVAA